ncbi:alpha,alpha-trehalose-phosphate synthase (UDP-forming) [Sphaerobacter thermophilus]|uniref:Alpha,alpha-trehalose-phosphate synthase (UDP-forming) n=1 Tax=Sphaerobacter thermophilus (strain ATCC 49802 / DSM 20745 / KCCM 41009 / NCIMB 13125 / S 6022) TaxID=479434 RepID=D1C568_SPHTD|nr:trehalose-6-phosphate synthase [Sphaerobacter thermophilus]ACZ39385.1 Alpha,alpha-trehalose-phosphate synthase (UDP- forming) [Sphaerobacter thermophilus DSM 20745]
MADEHGATVNADVRRRDLPDPARDLLSRVTLIIASNRGPVEFHREPDGSFSTRRGTGGVVTAISAVSRFTDAIWVAAAMTDGDRLRAELAAERGEAVIEPDNADFRVRFVVSDPEDYDRYYNHISNPLLWFLQHYLWDTPRQPDIDHITWDAWNNGYVTVNRQFAEEILAVADSSAQPPIVMLQDYHLYLVPGYLREARPDLILQHFVHIPWPDPDYWRLLPVEFRRAICHSMLANDIVGFQTPRHARSFVYTCEATLDDVDIDYRRREIRYRGHTTYVRSYPISIDVDAVRRVAASEDALRHEEHIKTFLNEHTILRVDRAEPSKNIVRGFQAYDRFLELHPEFLGRVNFLAFLVPSRLEVAEYVDYLDDINTIVGRINTKYANVAERDGVAWEPVRLFIGDDYPRALAAMKYYDVLLVNAIFDGMNLVAKEGALLNRRNGVLILSEGAGAYQQLSEHALSVSPADVESTAHAIYQALTMPPEQRAYHAQALRRLVIEQDILAWIYSQLEDLAATVGGSLVRE